MFRPAMKATRTTLLAIGLVCFANLLLEVCITRLFSATMFYHFTFLAIALALFGVAASGVTVFLRRDQIAEDISGALAQATRRCALAVFIAAVYALANPIDIIFVQGTSQIPIFGLRQFWQLILLVGVTAVPFYFAGLVVSIALSFYRDSVARVYFYDLAGAALAAVTASVVLGLLGGPGVIMLVVAVLLLAAALFAPPSRMRWLWPVLGAAILATHLVMPLVAMPTAKGVRADKVEFEAWNIFSRVTVDDTRTIKIDASAATKIEDLKRLTPTLHQPEVTALVHSMFAPAPNEVLVIGPGGGRDVLFALAAGAHHVTGVEVNPIIAEQIMKGRYEKASNGLYHDPRVNVVVDDGRSFVRRSQDHYDVVQASLVDTWAATAAGAFALTENTLYTLEAFEDYLDHLTDSGAMTITRWHSGDSGESARLLILAAGALERIGVPRGEVRKHIFYAISSKDGLGTLIAKRTPITPDEQARLEAACQAQKFTVAISPTTAGTSLLERYIDAGAWSDLVRSAAEELRPPTDDWPFFFYFKKLPDLLHPTFKMNDPGLWLMISLGAVFALSAAFVLLPLVLSWRRRDRGGVAESRGLVVGVLGYFGIVGFSFMVIEVGLMQRFTLFLGHPSYSLVVILFSILLSTAVGAGLSGRIAPARLGRGVLVGGAIMTVLGLVFAFVLGGLVRSWVGMALPMRIALTGVLVAPAGLVMGAMVPSIIRVLGDARSTLVPWGWGVNGATSVIGTVLATVIAIYAGFTVTLVCGAIGYGLAGAVGLAVVRAYARQDRAPVAVLATETPVAPSQPRRRKGSTAAR